MDLASLDATMGDEPGQHNIRAREQHGGKLVPLTDEQYRNLITVQLADWLEQVTHLKTCKGAAVAHGHCAAMPSSSPACYRQHHRVPTNSMTALRRIAQEANAIFESGR